MKFEESDCVRIHRIFVVTILVSFLVFGVFAHKQSTLVYSLPEEGAAIETLQDPVVRRSKSILSDTALGFPPREEFWNYTHDIHSTDHGYGMVLCSDTGYAITGASYGYLGTTSYDGYLLKMNSSGKREWTQGYGDGEDDILYDVKECEGGGFVLVGHTQSYGAGKRDIWLIRTDVDGNMIWNRTFGGSDEDYGYSVVECSDGSFAIAGYTGSFGAGGADAWVILTNSTGHHEWNMTLGRGSSDIARDILESSDGNLTIVGQTSSYSDGNQMWLIHLDFDGFHLWNETYGTTGSEYGRTLVECASGGYAMAGQTSDYAWLVRVDETGAMLWNHSYQETPSDFINGLVESKHGGFAMVGVTNLDMNWDVIVIRTNDAGDYLWNWTFGYSYNDWGEGIVEMADSGFAIGGAGSPDGDSDCLIIGLPDTPYWDEVVVDCPFEYNTFVSINLNATTPHGLDQWWINDTVQFAIDQTGLITNATPLGLGDYGIEVLVNDTLNYTLEGEFTIAIVDTTAPTWDQEPEDKFLQLGDAFQYDLNASDVFGIDHFWINDTDQFSIDSNGTITNKVMIPTGEHGVMVRAYDPSDNFCSGEFTVTAEDTIAPTWDQDPTNKTSEFGDKFEYDLDASDRFGIDHFWINDTVHFSINASGVITNKSVIPVGQYGITVAAFDPSNNNCSGEFTLTVEDTTNPAWLETPDDTYAEFNHELNYKLNATDLSGIESYWVNNSAQFNIEGRYLRNATALEVGYYPLEVRAYDPYDQYCSALLSVWVFDTLPPEWDDVLRNQTVEYGQPFFYKVNASDPSGIDHFDINAIYFDINDEGEITNNTFLDVDVYNIAVQAYDPYGHYCEGFIEITVEDTTPPVLGDLPDLVLLEYGEGFQYAVEATDLSGIGRFEVNLTSLITWTVLDPIPLMFTISESGVISNASTLIVADYGISVSVYDIYDNYAGGSIEIEVRDTTKPTFVNPPSTINLEYGEALEYQFRATDLSDIRFGMKQADGFEISRDGLLTNRSFLGEGQYSLTVRVYDYWDNMASHNVTIFVESPPEPPLFPNLLLPIALAIGGIVAVVIIVVILKKG